MTSCFYQKNNRQHHQQDGTFLRKSTLSRARDHHHLQPLGHGHSTALYRCGFFCRQSGPSLTTLLSCTDAKDTLVSCLRCTSFSFYFLRKIKTTRRLNATSRGRTDTRARRAPCSPRPRRGGPAHSSPRRGARASRPSRSLCRRG